MKSPGQVHIVLDLEPTEGTIRGQLAVGGDHASSFHGWLELIDRLERAADGERVQSSDPRDANEG